MPQLTYYVVRPNALTPAPSTLNRASYKGELYISPHVRMSGMDSEAKIDTRERAEKFAEAILPKLQKRHGEQLRLTVMEVSCYDDKWSRKKILEHSEIIQKRMDTNNFAANKPV